MTDYRSRLGHHLDEADQAELRAEVERLRAFRAQYADDAAATKGGRERLEHAERERDEARAAVATAQARIRELEAHTEPEETT